MKQFKNLILAGALVVGLAGFAVSCNKYGDDIDEIRSELNKLATKDDVASQIASLQSALSTAQSAASEAKAAADKALADAKAAGDQAAAAKAAADKAAAEAKEAVLAEIEEKLGALQEQLESVTEDALAEVAKAVEDAKKELEEITGAIADSITSIELVSSFAKGQTFPIELAVTSATEQDNVFSEGIADAITFVKGEQYQTPAEPFLVRVSPSNAVLTKEMISFVNSKGENLDEIVDVEVEPYKGLLSKAAEQSGLWNVTVKLKAHDDAFTAAAYDPKPGKTFKEDDNETYKRVLFAIQANNTSYSEVRYATSSYDLTFAWTAYEPVGKLEYFVDETNVNEINNRFPNNYAEGVNPSLPLGGNTSEAEEWRWSNKPAVAPVLTPENKKNVTKDTEDASIPEAGDSRGTLPVYPAVQDKAITIKVGSKNENDEIVENPNIRAIYVTLDKEEFAVESAPSEWNAWNSYVYTGLNKVVEGTSTEIIISSAKGAVNDIIGFRVYAVNYDGTLVDPDGKAFYVKLGNVADDWNSIATTVIPQSAELKDDKLQYTTEPAAMSATKLTGAHHFEWTTDKIGTTQPVFHATFQNANNQTVFATNGTISSTLEFEKITKVVTTPANINDWKLYEDNKAYTGTLTIYNESNHVLATVKVSMTKVLPTKAPDGFSAKDKQIINGVWDGYLIPVYGDVKENAVFIEKWGNDTATYGAMALDNVFNFGKGVAENYEFIFAASKFENNKNVEFKANGAQNLSVAARYIDNETKHSTTVQYNYGQISSVKKDGQFIDVIIPDVYTFESIYHDIYDENTYTWDWATREQLNTLDEGNYTQKNSSGAYILPLPYDKSIVYGRGNGEMNDEGDYLTLDLGKAIYGTSNVDGLYNAFLYPSYKESVKVVMEEGSATLISDATEEEDYFTIEVSAEDGKAPILTFKPKSGTTNPKDDVASTLTITFTDMYSGHEHEIKLKMTVKKRP